jgi:hypothetical protein
MKQITIFRFFFSPLGWVSFGLLLISYFSLTLTTATAQNPTAVPTATVAATFTPNSVPVAPTPLPIFTPVPGATSTPSGRFIEFRSDEDEIDMNECVLLSWVVRGDFLLVELNQEEDNKDAELVSEMDSREECLDDTTEYELIVTWSDNTEEAAQLEIEVSDQPSSDDSDGGGSSGTGGSGGGTPSVGTFIIVTPILITDSLADLASPQASPTPAALASSDGSNAPPPSGVLGTIQTLPETGEQPTELPLPESGLGFFATLGVEIFGLIPGLVLLAVIFHQFSRLYRREA